MFGYIIATIVLGAVVVGPIALLLMMLEAFHDAARLARERDANR
jgi:hypothetical protein